ncbi:hypothetical protein M0R45_018562 [Rubus argutus]|uniref:EF-hand domain-containing protein n=1 Tax=Rubus argutus TaxID=59490 RepID=A0AAW1X493_RUBAR
MHDDAASAYYKNLPAELQQKAKEKFNEMDSDGSKTISSEEFQRSMGISSEIKGCFELLDKNKDGKLNFNEFITLYYLVEGGEEFSAADMDVRLTLFSKDCTLLALSASITTKLQRSISAPPATATGSTITSTPTFWITTSCCVPRLLVNPQKQSMPNPGNSNRVIGRGIEMASDLLGQPELGTQISPMSDQVGQPRSKRRALVGLFNSAKANVGLGDVSAESCSIM